MNGRIAGRVAVVAALVLSAGVLQAQRAIDPSKTKSGEAVKLVFRAVVGEANQSTVVVRTDEKGVPRQVALGTVVDADGYILTKGSEVLGQGKVYVSLRRQGGGLRNYDAKVVGYSETLDLAMLKIAASGLKPVVFADTRSSVPDAPERGRGFGRGRGGRGRNGGGGGGGRGTPVMPMVTTAPAPAEGAIAVDVGEWVATANPAASMEAGVAAEEPAMVGVISLARRRITGRNDTFLGVMMGDTTDNTGARIMQVEPESAAEKAGLKVDDVVSSVNGEATLNHLDLGEVIRRHRPGDVISLAVARGDESLTLRATLGTRQIADDEQSMMQMLTGGPVSGRASGFPAVYQHDTVLQPNFCGGPLVDLEGHVLGINIARAGRTETYALPADVIVPLIEPLKSGKLAPAALGGAATKPAAP